MPAAGGGGTPSGPPPAFHAPGLGPWRKSGAAGGTGVPTARGDGIPTGPPPAFHAPVSIRGGTAGQRGPFSPGTFSGMAQARTSLTRSAKVSARKVGAEEPRVPKPQVQKMLLTPAAAAALMSV